MSGVERAKAEAAVFRDSLAPQFVRVYEDARGVIWSKVDSEGRDLTADNSDGVLNNYRSLFVPHGAPHPLDAQARIAELEAENMEQARLLGMSAERELAAQSRIAELEAELAAAREALEAISMPSPRRKALRPQYAGLLAREIAIRALAGGPTA